MIQSFRSKEKHSHHTATTNHYQKHIHAYHSTDTLALWLSSSSRLPSFSSSLQTHWQRTHGYCWTIHSITQSLSHLYPPLPFCTLPSLPLLFPPSHNRTCSKPQTGRQHGFEVLYEKEGGHCHDGLGKRRKDTPTRRETARPSDEGKELVGDWRKLRVVYKWQSQDTRCHDM